VGSAKTNLVSWAENSCFLSFGYQSRGITYNGEEIDPAHPIIWLYMLCRRFLIWIRNICLMYKYRVHVFRIGYYNMIWFDRLNREKIRLNKAKKNHIKNRFFLGFWLAVRLLQSTLCRLLKSVDLDIHNSKVFISGCSGKIILLSRQVSVVDAMRTNVHCTGQTSSLSIQVSVVDAMRTNVNCTGQTSLLSNKSLS